MTYSETNQVVQEKEANDATYRENVTNHEVDENATQFDDVETRRLLRKVDWRVLPILSFLYLLAFLDRSNLGNAKVAGLSDDLALTGSQFNLAATVFFFPYSVLEVPANVALKLLRPSLWIGCLVIAWGTVTTCTGAIQNYGGLLAVRIFLGVTEAGFFPAATYLVSTWFCRFEVQTRIAIFYCAASLAGAFSGLLAFAISKMDGVAGIAGWRWIFILEGIVTVLTGIVVLLALPDSIERAKWLSPEEKRFLRQRLEQDTGTKEGRQNTTEKFQLRYLMAALKDWKLWFSVFIYWGNTVPAYAFTFTAPQIILNLGYTAANAQLLTVPIYMGGLMTTLICGRLADRYKTRWKFIVFPYCFALIGFIGLLSTPESLPGLTYAFLFFVTMGCYPGVITLVSWIANNIAPSSKRACGMALSLMMANLGGAVGSNIFLADELPRYWTGYGLSAGFLVLAIGCVLLLRFVLMRENERRDRLTESEIRAQYTEDELLDLGDKSPLYRYVY